MIKFGILGCGKIAERHAALLTTGAVPGACLHGVYDLDTERGNAFARRYGAIHFREVGSMASVVDAFTILTPSGSHAKNTEDLAPFGKAIVVEKPMALTLADADRMISACARYGARLFVVKQNRFNRPVIALRRAIEAGRFGKLVLGSVRVRWCRPQEYYDSARWRGTWLFDGGVLANQASHHIDLLEWMFGEIEMVCGMATQALARIEAEDTAVAVLRFKSGALGVIEATTATRPKDLEGSLSVLGAGGSVVVGGFSANELVSWKFATQVAGDESVFEEWGRNPLEPSQGYAHAAYYKHVVECINTGNRALVDGVEGRKSLATLVALYESIEVGHAVHPGELATHCKLGKG